LNFTILLAQAAVEDRLFGLDSQTLIGALIQFVNVLILTGALSFILYKPVKEYMEKRSLKIKGQMEDAEKAKQKAEALVAEFEARLKDIDDEAEKILEDARLKAAEEGRAIVENAKHEAEAILKRAQEKIEFDKIKLREESRLYIIELAVNLAQKYIESSIDDNAKEQLFEEAISKLELSKWQS